MTEHVNADVRASATPADVGARDDSGSDLTAASRRRVAIPRPPGTSRRRWERPSAWRAADWRARWRQVGPYLVATLLLIAGYLHYQDGAWFSLSDSAYRNWAFPAFRYSDLIWLYLRDGLAQQPLPYRDYALEYPPLTGLVSYLLSYLPSLPAYYLGAYLVLSGAVLATIWALSRLPGANPWLYALAPALYFYTGHQWDGIAIGATAISLIAICRGQERWGMAGLALGVSLKLFAVVFVPALLLDHLRRRQFRQFFTLSAIFGLVTVACNLPVALINAENWSWFFRWNRDRLADAGIWVLWRDLPTATSTNLSLLAVASGGLVITALALRARGPLMLPLGATYLLWWMVANKTFTTHLVLWVFFALALLGAAWWLWGAMVATDLVGFQLGNYINLYNVAAFQHTPLIQKAVLSIYDPLQVIRAVILLVGVGWGLRTTWRTTPLPDPAPDPGDRGQPAAGALVAASAPPAPSTTPAAPLPDMTPGALAIGSVAPLPAVPSSRPRDTAPGGNGVASDAAPTAADTLTAAAAPATAVLATAAHPRVDRRGRIGLWLLVLLGFSVATVLMTWPYARHLSDSTLAGFDPLLQIWLSQWIQHALATDPLNLYQANIFHPFALTLAYTDANIPGALIAWPLDLVTRDPILTNSLLVLASFVFAAAGMFAFVRALTGNVAAGFLAGLAYAFIPYRMVHLWHLNWLQSAWLPWIALVTFRLLERPTRRRGALLGLLIAIQVLTSFYFAVQIGLLVGGIVLAAVLARPHLRHRRLAGSLGVTLLVAALLLVPAYIPYLQVREDQGLERSLDDAEHYKATPASYLRLPSWDRPNPLWGWLGQQPGPNEALTQVGQAVHADGHQHGEIVIEDALFPGLLAVIGACLGLALWRRQRWLTSVLAAITAIAVVLSFGPSWGPPDGSGFPLPYRFLFEYVPFFRAMRVPARLGGLAALTLVALAGLGVAAAWALWLRPRLGSAAVRRRVATAGTALLSGLILFELFAAPIPLEAVDRSAAQAAPYEWLAAQPPGVVMEFPAESIFADPAGSSVRRHVGLRMFWSTTHWQALVNGNSGFIPEPYSDLVEAFVGQIPRPDGSRTGRISHVSPDTVGLLRTLDVRYLVFHRDQYRAEDWPAVADQLAAAEGAISRVGDFGEATIYELEPTVRPQPGPRLTLWSPTLLGPDMPWAPLVSVENRAGEPSLLSLTEPATLDVTWYDDQGRELYRGEEPLPLPTVLTSDAILCSVAECEATTARFPQALPPPENAFWRPEEEGHYFVRITLDGDQPLRCLVDLDVTGDLAHIEDISPENPFRWAECVPGGTNPVNNPGAVPFGSGPPSITFIGGMAAVQVPLIANQAEEVRGWFFLAPPNSPVPWTDYIYQSPIDQRLLQPDEQTEFEWLVDLGRQVPTGVYSLSVWFHQRDAGEWVHAYGSGYQLAPVVIENGAARWAGPVRIRLESRALLFASGQSTRLRVEVGGTNSRIECDGRWRLVDSGEAVVATGFIEACAEPVISVPGTVAPGRYRLEIDASAVRDDRVTLSDGLTRMITVRSPEQPGQPR